MKIDSSISAVVTGGASGLGEETVRALRRDGASVAIFDMNDERGNALAAQVGATYVRVDVTSEESVDAGFAQARAIQGQERVLVNCAGIVKSAKTASRVKGSSETRHFPLDVYEAVLKVNLFGTFRCIAKSAQGMLGLPVTISGDRGVIVNTASVAATDGQVGQAAYSASKAAIVGMTLPIARDLAAEAIRVNTILPGTFQTPMMKTLPDEVQKSLAAAVPFPSRLGDPAEFASLVLEICRNAYINAESIRIDGAIRMSPR
jgi:NAD(P)-dependent dehydrogenase (short-subunit alcohol dehydrogenase family)